MDTERNFLDYYGIEHKEKSLDSNFFLEEDFSLDKAVEKVTKKDIKTDNYKLHKRKIYEDVRFSTDKWNDPSPEIFVLGIYRKWKILENITKPIAALRYYTGSGFGGMHWIDFPSWNRDPENFLGIYYVQTMTKVSKRDYQDAIEILGSRPHELLVANFLSHIAPIIDSRPQTKVVLQPSHRTSRKTLRDRFFDKNWELSPNKQRVRQLLGEDNAWLKPEAIKKRETHYVK